MPATRSPRPAFPLAAAVVTTVAACAAPVPPPAPPPAVRAPAGAVPAPDASSTGEPWVLGAGTTTLGFGILRLAPPPGAERARFRIRFEDRGDGGYASDATSAVLLVLPGDAFERSRAAHADSWLAFARAENDGGYGPVVAEAEVSVDRDRTVLVAYGPWDGADVGRPPSDHHTFTLSVEVPDGGNYRWVESEAGEMVTTNWTRRPGVARGGPAADPLTGEAVWIETRILVLYDPKWARPADAPPATEADRERLALLPDLHAVLERVPIRWR